MTSSNAVHWLHTTPQTEGNDPTDTTVQSEVSCSVCGQTVRQVTNGYQSCPVLGNQQRSLQNTMDQSSLLTGGQSPEGDNASYWCEWYCEELQLFI